MISLIFSLISYPFVNISCNPLLDETMVLISLPQSVQNLLNVISLSDLVRSLAYRSFLPQSGQLYNSSKFKFSLFIESPPKLLQSLHLIFSPYADRFAITTTVMFFPFTAPYSSTNTAFIIAIDITIAIVFSGHKVLVFVLHVSLLYLRKLNFAFISIINTVR
jgi:hypothetical protein